MEGRILQIKEIKYGKIYIDVETEGFIVKNLLEKNPINYPSNKFKISLFYVSLKDLENLILNFEKNWNSYIRGNSGDKDLVFKKLQDIKKAMGKEHFILFMS